MKNGESEPKKEGMSLEEMAERLDEMQRDKFEGRGVSHIKTVIVYLRAGDIDRARAVCFNESDKFSQIPDIKDFVVHELFHGEAKHPWSFLEQLQERRVKREREK